MPNIVACVLNIVGIRRIENLSSCTNIRTLVLCGNQVWRRLTQPQEYTVIMQLITKEDVLLSILCGELCWLCVNAVELCVQTCEAFGVQSIRMFACVNGVTSPTLFHVLIHDRVQESACGGN